MRWPWSCMEKEKGEHEYLTTAEITQSLLEIYRYSKLLSFPQQSCNNIFNTYFIVNSLRSTDVPFDFLLKRHSFQTPSSGVNALQQSPQSKPHVKLFNSLFLKKKQYRWFQFNVHLKE